jgi:hypothetical protein
VALTLFMGGSAQSAPISAPSEKQFDTAYTWSLSDETTVKYWTES